MRFVSWNVNGLRACMQKGFLDFFHAANADFFCLQETKLQEGQISLELPGYEQYWCYAEKKGYSGTAIFTKHTPISVAYGMGIPEMDTEGRLITLEYPEFYLITCYTPNAQRGLARIEHRLKWEDAFRNYLNNLDRKKPVIVCGDLNVAHKEIDLKNPGSNRGNAGFSDEERCAFSKLLACGFTDSFRHLHPDATGAYTWWSYMFNARQNNAGWRIDYFLTSNRISEQIFSAPIYSDILGSDHCPVGLDLDIACNGGVWPSFECARSVDKPEEEPDKKSSGIKAAAALLCTAVLLAGIYFFPHSSPATTTPTDDSSVSVSRPDTSQLLILCTQSMTELSYKISAPSIYSSILEYSGFIDGTKTIHTDKLSPLPANAPCDVNFWIRIVPATDADLSMCNILPSFDPIVQHEDPYPTVAQTTRFYDENGSFAGWYLFGYVPRDTNMKILLEDQYGVLQEVSIHIQPVLTASDAKLMTTQELTDYALHSEALSYAIALDNTSAQTELFYALWQTYPALLEFSFREGAVPKLQEHATLYPNCKENAQSLQKLIEAHRQIFLSYGEYITVEEAETLSTDALADYLCSHKDFNRFLTEFQTKLNMPFDVYRIAKQFNPALVVFEQREDAVEALLARYGTCAAANYMMVQPAYMKKLTLMQAQELLDKISEGNGIETLSTDNLAMVIASVFHVNSSLQLSYPYNYAQLRLAFTPLQELEKREDAHTVLISYLTESTGLITDAQKSTATLLLSREPFYSRLSELQLGILERGGLIIYGDTTIAVPGLPHTSP